MDGVAGCFERPLHINDGGFLTTVSSLFFRQQSGNNLQLHPAQKRKNDLMGDGIHFRNAKSGSVSTGVRRRSSSRSLCAAVFRRNRRPQHGEGGPRATFYEGAGFGPPNTSFNPHAVAGRITISP